MPAAGAVYLAVSLAIWGNVWSSHPTSATVCGCGDASQFTWFLAWPAHALAHGLDPLYSTAIGYPHGVNLLSNTSVVALGVVLAPVTWLFGPVATLNVALALSPALSALAMFVLLRRWVDWAPAAFGGGLLYGFSPLILVSLSNAWLTLGMGVVPPLVVAGLDDILVRQRGRPLVQGLILGLLVTLQFFLSTEVLLIMVIAAGVGVALVVAYAAARSPATLRARARYAATGLSTGGITAAALLAYPTWFALAGPAHLSGSIWGPNSLVGNAGNSWRNFLFPASPSSAAAHLFHRFGGYQGPVLSPQYLGIGVVVVLTAGWIVWHRDRRLWLFGAVGLTATALSFGLEPHHWTPWRLVARLPLLENIEPYRWVLVIYLAASVMLALVIDHARAAVRRRAAGRPATAIGPAPEGRMPAARWVSAAVGCGVAAAALLGPALYVAQTVPMTTAPVALPAWFRTAAFHQGHQVILVLPDSDLALSPLTWQAVDGMPYATVAKVGPGGAAARAGKDRVGQAVVAEVSDFTRANLTAEGVVAVRRLLADRGVTMVVMPVDPGLPEYARVPSPVVAAVLMAATTGQPPRFRAGAWVWSAVDTARAGPVPTTARLVGCAGTPTASGTPAVRAAADCVLAEPGSD